jgi:hypothetical protein
MRYTLYTLALLLPLIAAKLQAQTPQRLQAQSYYLYNFASGRDVLYDSVRYAYRGWNGSRYNPNSLEYTPAGAPYDYAVIFGGDPTLQLTATNNIDSGYFLSVDYDTARRYQNGLKEYDSYRNHSSGTGPSVDEFYQRGSSPGYRAIHQYNGAQLTRVVVIFKHPATGSWDTALIRSLRYDASGRLVLDSISQNQGSRWTEQDSYRYSYGTGKGYTQMDQHGGQGWAPGSIKTSRRIQNTYYPDGRLHRSEIYARTASGARLAISQIDSFAYSPGIKGHTFYKSRFFDTLGNQTYWTYAQNLRTNAAGLKDSGIYVQSSQPDTPTSAYSIVYNAAGDPLRRNNYDYPLSWNARRSFEVYYYEPVQATYIWPPLSPVYSFSLYPNPVREALTISSGNYPVGCAVLLRIHNAPGQLLYQEQLPWTGSSHTVPLGAILPPGHYFLQLYETDGTPLYSTQVVKE